MVSHIPLTELVPLAGCLVLVGAELQSDEQRCQHGDADRCAASITALATKCKNAKKTTASKGAMDEFMRGLVAAADVENTAENTESVRIWRDAVISAASAVSCEKCCKAESVCQGGNYVLQDSKTIDSHGLCIARLKAAFDDALLITSKAYHHAKGRNLNTVRLSTKVIQHNSGALANLFTCGAAFNIVGGQPHVILSVDPRGYTVASYFSTLYLFVHELFSHAKCGISTGTEQSQVSLSFSEGWMDWVAVHSIDYLGDECDLKSDARLKWSSALAQAYSYHDARIDLGRNPESGGTYRYGAIAAQRLFSLFRGVTPEMGKEKAFWYVAQFSMEINASRRTDEERSLLVDKVSQYLGASCSPVRTLARAPEAWIPAIRQYIADADANQLFKRLTS
jgi:hypothetical protein